jgi:hypothetical protein
MAKVEMEARGRCRLTDPELADGLNRFARGERPEPPRGDSL